MLIMQTPLCSCPGRSQRLRLWLLLAPTRRRRRASCRLQSRSSFPTMATRTSRSWRTLSSRCKSPLRLLNPDAQRSSSKLKVSGRDSFHAYGYRFLGTLQLLIASCTIVNGMCTSCSLLRRSPTSSTIRTRCLASSSVIRPLQLTDNDYDCSGLHCPRVCDPAQGSRRRSRANGSGGSPVAFDALGHCSVASRLICPIIPTSYPLPIVRHPFMSPNSASQSVRVLC